jgi:hypothetical protein
VWGIQTSGFPVLKEAFGAIRAWHTAQKRGIEACAPRVIAERLEHREALATRKMQKAALIDDRPAIVNQRCLSQIRPSHP